MSTIFILKEIMDLLYEESKRGELITTDVESRLRNLEKMLEEKNKEISKLYTENIRLENIVRRYEHEFSILSNMPIVPVSFSCSSSPEEKKVEKEVVLEQTNVEKTETVAEQQVEQQQVQQQQQKPKSKGKDRREYMAEYQRNYRKAKREREKNTVINV